MSHPESAAHGEGHPEVGHVVPLPVLAGVLGLLLFLTVATVAATWVDLGRLNIWLALAIATVKAAFVVLYFMHLRYDRPFNGVILIISLALVMLFIGIALTDTEHYQPDLIPGYAPAISNAPK
jgi:cytochrome c oxidase subunit 4